MSETETEIEREGDPHLDHAALVHTDAVVGVPGELEQGLGGGLVDRRVGGLEVAHQGRHGPRLAERHPVAAPHAAAGDGLGQVAAELVVGLRQGREGHTQDWMLTSFFNETKRKPGPVPLGGTQTHHPPSRDYLRNSRNVNTVVGRDRAKTTEKQAERPGRRGLWVLTVLVSLASMGTTP